MSVFSKIRGTIETIFQIGNAGPQLKNNSGVIEARNSGDSGFVVVRGAAPVGDNDFATRIFVEKLAARYVVTAQFDGNNALPSNSGSEHFIVVTTTGPNATIGQLLYDNGSGSGTVSVVTAVGGNLIVTTAAFGGGTITLLSDSLYMWDAGSSSWVNAGGSSVSGAVREIRYAITNSATQDSATQIPANAQVIETEVEIVTPYSGGATISVGQSGSLSLLQSTSDNLATVAGTYQVPQDVAWGGTPLAVRTTVGGAPAAGAGFTIVRYTLPNL